MANDNTLGAPTEGLGQNVTFAFNGQRGTPQLQLGDTALMRGGIRGGGTVAPGATQAGMVPEPKPDATMAILMKVGDSILRPRLEEAKVAAYVGGMQKAMQGQSVKEIAEEQPWYAKIFGDSDVVEGARAYSSQAIAQNQMAAMIDQMPELRKLSPEAAQAFYTKQVNDSLTGDAATDGSILTAVTRSLPGVMRQQAKEHYGWQQENASMREAEAFRAGVKGLQASAKGLAEGYTKQEDFNGMMDQFERSLMPAVGRDEKSYRTSITNLMIGAAVNGDFHALRAMQGDDTRPGLVSVLDADQRTQVEKAIEAGQSKLRTKYSGEWNDDLVNIRALATKPDVGMTGNDVAERIDKLNNRFKQQTGSREDLILPGDRAGLLSGLNVTIAREKDRISADAAKAAAKAEIAGDKAMAEGLIGDEIVRRAFDGSLGTLSANPKMGAETINAKIVPIYRSMKPQDQVKMLVDNMRESYVIAPIRMEREGAVTAVLGEQDATPAVQKVMAEYTLLREANPVAADAYYGKHATAMEGMYNDLKAGMSFAGSFRSRFISPGARTKLGQQDMKAALGVVNSDYQTLGGYAWLGGQKLKPGTDRQVVNLIGEDIERFADATGNVQEATKRALEAGKRNGLELMGGYTWQNNKGQRPLADYLTRTSVGGSAPVATDKLNEEFENAVDELLYGKDDTHGIAPSSTSDVAVIRLPDQGGVPTFHVQAVVDGKTYDGQLAATDIYKLSAKRKAKLTVPPARESAGGFGTIDQRGMMGAPKRSIYN